MSSSTNTRNTPSLMQPSLPPTESNPRPSTTRIELPSPTALHPLLTLLHSDTNITPLVRDLVHTLFKRHVRITKPASHPLPSPDRALRASVEHLEAEVQTLSTRLSSTRARTIAKLESTLLARVAVTAAAPSPLRPVSPVPPLLHEALAEKNAVTTTSLPARFDALRTEAERARRCTASVRDVLKVLSHNAPPDRAIVEEFTASFEFPHKRQSHEVTPDNNSPVPMTSSTDRDQQVFCPISPHVTPRSKMRKRLARSASRGSMRQPSFSGLDMLR